MSFLIPSVLVREALGLFLPFLLFYGALEKKQARLLSESFFLPRGNRKKKKTCFQASYGTYNTSKCSNNRTLPLAIIIIITRTTATILISVSHKCYRLTFFYSSCFVFPYKDNFLRIYVWLSCIILSSFSSYSFSAILSWLTLLIVNETGWHLLYGPFQSFRYCKS